MKKALFVLPLLIGAFLLLDRFAHRDEHRFTLPKVKSFMARTSDWDIPEMDPQEKAEVKKILSQPFTYFDKGSQAYVFMSEDQNYVLKLFKQHKLRPATWMATLANLLPEHNYKYKYKKKKFREALVSCKNAFVGFKEDTGLLYLHLNKGPDICQEVICIDERGERISVNLDETVFMLQKRADLIYPSLAKLMRQGEIEQAKGMISGIFDLLIKFDREGVYGNDPVLKKNFGVIQGKIAQIDVGRFRVEKGKAYRENIPRITEDLKNYVTSNFPELSSHFEQELTKCPEVK